MYYSLRHAKCIKLLFALFKKASKFRRSNVTLLLVSTVEAIDDRVLPPSISSSENALDIPESVDTESTAAGPENTLVPFVDVG